MRERLDIPNENGAAAVEFALIAGVLMMLIFGMLQFGIAFFELQTLRAATREGARLGAVGADVPQIQARVDSAALGVFDGDFSSIDVTYTDGVSETPGAACPEPSEQDEGSRVRVSIDVSSAPAAVQQTFSVDIPMMPPITLDPEIEGEFRCEGV